MEISVTYKDNTDTYHPDAIVATNNTTPITLLPAPSCGVINIVELIKIYNPDTQANTVQIIATDTVIYTRTIGPDQSIILSQESVIIGELGDTSPNADLNNLSTTGKAVVSNLPMPSSSYIDLTLGASGSTYTAPADGYVFLFKGSTVAYQYVFLQNSSSGGLRSQTNAPTNGACPGIFIPVKKNDQVYYEYNLGGATVNFRFIYAEGSKP